MAGALARLGVDRALVVSGEDGLDEMSTSAPTHVVEVNGDADRALRVAPEDVGLEAAPATPSPAAPPRTTRAATRAILAGEPGPRADLALLNAGAAIYAGRRAEVARRASTPPREAIASGAAPRAPGAPTST